MDSETIIEKTNTNALGVLLRKLREDKGNSQADLAKLLNVKAQTYSAYERGVSLPDVNALVVLADFFGVTTDYLLGNGKKPAYSVYNSGHISDGAVVQGQNLGTVMVSNGDCANAHAISDEAAELVRVYELLDVKRRYKLLGLALSLEEDKESDSRASETPGRSERAAKPTEGGDQPCQKL